MEQIAIPTPAALRIAGMSTAEFRTAINRGDFVSAPETARGRRVWEVNRMTCLAWFSSLLQGGMKRPMAGALADQLQRAIERDPDAEEFSVFMWADSLGFGHLAIGREAPTEMPSAPVVMVMPIQQWRQRVQAAMDAHLAGRRAAHARGR